MKTDKYILFLLALAGSVGTATYAANRNSDIDLLPFDIIEFDFYAGHQPQSPFDQITINNSGEGLVRWSAATDSGFLSISPSSGSLLPHRSFALALELGDLKSL